MVVICCCGGWLCCQLRCCIFVCVGGHAMYCTTANDTHTSHEAFCAHVLQLRARGLCCIAL
ncbi:hypothetical protein BDZ91DRAFT_737838, partial [Kalaharituber pfeilii]